MKKFTIKTADQFCLPNEILTQGLSLAEIGVLAIVQAAHENSFADGLCRYLHDPELQDAIVSLKEKGLCEVTCEGTEVKILITLNLTKS